MTLTCRLAQGQCSVHMQAVPTDHPVTTVAATSAHRRLPSHTPRHKTADATMADARWLEAPAVKKKKKGAPEKGSFSSRVLVISGEADRCTSVSYRINRGGGERASKPCECLSGRLGQKGPSKGRKNSEAASPRGLRPSQRAGGMAGFRRIS